MKYLKGVLDESLRLYPPVPIDGKVAINDDVLPNGMKIRAGWGLAWSAWVMGRHPDFWENPTEVRPERWFENGSQLFNGGKSVPYQYPPFIPFNYGPRTCLGLNMAYLEAKVLICLILQKYKLRLVPGHPIVPAPAITIYSKHGMLMTVEPR